MNRPDDKVLLSLSHVSIAYGAIPAVEDVSFSVEEGEFFCIVGANGSGKSTLIRGILGLTPLTKGRVDLKTGLEGTAYVPQVEGADRAFPATVWELVLTGTQRRGWRAPFYARVAGGGDGAAPALRGDARCLARRGLESALPRLRGRPGLRGGTGMTFQEVWEVLSYPFVTRALIVGVMVSLCASILGVILVLKRYSLIGHGLSEVGFAALSVALAFNLPPLYVSTPRVIAASFVIMFVSQRRRVGGDVAIGIAASAALAFGVLVTALTRGMNLDVCSYMFGSILAMTNEDVVLSVALSLFVTGLFILFYNRLLLITYNEDYARSLGINVTLYQFLISFLTALTVVLGMRMMGTLLISSLIILPAVTARRLVSSFRALVVTSACISLICFAAGLALSFVWNLPTGASIVSVNVAALIGAVLLSRLMGRTA